eukprot:TRINITY_DN6841_c0_g1_i2.p1 TRINITY_DN6841_c0_g1~~TRINITY_DN6841_c0_g1_i2.p1  ORF type:complete len:582 (-),score=85.12 TRINITY_DN6841_c0_g1_i2:1075-2820(-)
MPGKGAIVWFRKGLRLHDNLALHHAIQSHAPRVYPIFVIDPWFLHPDKVGINRLQFLLQSLQDIDTQLRKQCKTQLFVLRGDPIQEIPKAAKHWDVDLIIYEKDTEPYAKKRDAGVASALASEKPECEIRAVPGHTLWDLDLLLKKNGGKAPLTMSSFTKLANSMPTPGPPVPSPQGVTLQAPRSGLVSSKRARLDNEKDEIVTQATDSLAVPDLSEFPSYKGLQPTGKALPGGESAALGQLAKMRARGDAWIASFSKPAMAPTTIEPSTTSLSPYLKFGCLSPRTFYHELQAAYSRMKGKHTQPPTSLLGQLYWREFFYLAAHATPNFDRMQGNPICKQISWDRNLAIVRAWENAQTGYPWIDACMTQLREQGWLNHLSRHCVACFLTRGDLWQHWELGRDVFDKLLIDADWSLNNANWMWLSASSFFYQYHRVYGPHSFAKKTDKEGKYVKHFLPVLKNFPAKYIYTPWEAPIDVQRKAGCIIGKDYPWPIVNHQQASQANKDKMNQCYKESSNIPDNIDIASPLSYTDPRVSVHANAAGELVYVTAPKGEGTGEPAGAGVKQEGLLGAPKIKRIKAEK